MEVTATAAPLEHEDQVHAAGVELTDNLRDVGPGILDLRATESKVKALGLEAETREKPTE